MPHHRRVEEPDRYWLLSNRTHEGKFLFRPDDECCRIARGCLAWWADQRDVRLVAYVFLSNHFHLVAGFPKANRGDFMRDFQGELSSRIKDHRPDHDGQVFSKPYHDLALLDPESLLNRISYTVNNAVRHGLVTHAEAWPGVCSVERHRDEEPLVGRWLDSNKWYNLSRRKNPPSRQEAMVEHAVDLHIPESLPGDTDAERREAMLDKIEEDRTRFCKETGLQRHLRPDDPTRFKESDWRKRESIEETWCKKRKLCAGSDPGAVADYIQERRNIDESFREAAEDWKAGHKATFPAGTYPPGRSKPVMDQAARAPPT